MASSGARSAALSFSRGHKARTGEPAATSAGGPAFRIRNGSRDLRRLLLESTALVGFTVVAAAPMTGGALIASLISTAAMADGGNGGSAVGGLVPGGAGGADGQPGGNGGDGGSVGGGGGGGGGGAGGGAGGTGGTGAGGTAGGTAGLNGGGATASGSSGGGGGGGNGGQHGQTVNADETINAAVAGTAGGKGGNGGSASISAFHGGGGGGGGAGGHGAVVTGGTNLTIDAAITGGGGGNGGAGGRGNGTYAFAGGGGSGGDGGIGVNVTVGGVTLTNNGVINGGNGGAGGPGGTAVIFHGAFGAAGAGGAGVVGANLTIFNNGTITGGLAGGGGAQANAVTFTGGANAITFGAAAAGLSGNIDVTGTLTLDNTVANTTVDSIITGTGSVTKAGSNTITLTGANTYSGGTHLNGGTLSVGSDANLGHADGALNFNGGTLRITGTTFGSTARTINWGSNGGGFEIADAAHSFAVSQILSGTGGLSKTGAGTLVLNGNNTFSGGVTINGGTLSVGSDANLGDAAGALNFNGGTLRITGTTFGSTARAINWGASGGGFDIADAAHSFAVSQILSGTGGLAKTGNGTLILNGNNTFSGGVTINGGTISAGHNNALGTGTFTVLGSTLDIADGVTISNAANLKANLDISVDGCCSVGTYAGNISSTGDFGMKKIGAGTLVLSGTNTYTGGTRVTEGVLQLGDDAAKGSIVGTVRVVDDLAAFSIVNADTSGITRIVNNGWTRFFNDTNAGTARITNNYFAFFFDNSSAGTAAITNNGLLAFGDGSGAANATITNNLYLSFSGTSTAGAAIITNRGGGLFGGLSFSGNSTAGNATITTRSGAETFFEGNADGGNARFITRAGGVVDFSASSGPSGDGRISAGSIEGAGTYYIGGGNTLTVGGNNRSTEVSGEIANDCGCGAGDGSLVKVGTGTLTLSGINTYRGGTTVREGVVSVGTEANLGDTAGALTLDGGMLRVTGHTFGSTVRAINLGSHGGGFDIVRATHTFAVSQILSGSGGLLKTGAGTLELTGNNSFSGGVTINGGTISAGHNNALGTGTFTVLGSTLDIQDGVTISNAADLKANLNIRVEGCCSVGTYAGDIASTGDFGVKKIGTGTLVLSGTNTYTGGTRVTDGVLQLGDDAAKGSIVGRVRVGSFGTFDVVNADTSGMTRITNYGLTSFFNNTDAGSARFINNGFGWFQDNSSAGTARITNNGLLQFTDNASAASSSVTNHFGLGFVGNSTAGNATITNRGGLLFAENSTAGNATITTTKFAETLFAENADGGNAKFITRSGGLVDFSFGTGPAGDGRISAGSIEGAGTYIIGGGNTLTVGSNDRSTEVWGEILNDCGCGAGDGSLVKVGTGTLTLSGINSYRGTTSVDGGTLLVNGSIAASSLTTVGNGATLGGNGVVGNTVIGAGGTLAPGNSIGRLDVNGNLAFNPSATYLVELGSSSSDRTDATGTASLAGTVRTQIAPGQGLSRQYTILSAAGGLGGTTFGALNSSGVPNFGLGLIYRDDTDVLLQLSARLGWGSGQLTQNQQNVASALNSYFNQGGTLPSGFVKLFGLTGDPLRNALNQASGEYGASVSTSTFMAWNSFFNLMFDPFAQNRGGFGGGATAFTAEGPAQSDAVRLAYAAVSPKGDLKGGLVTKAPPAAESFAARWSVWGGGYGGSAQTDGNGQVGSHDTTSRAYGFAIGADHRLTPDTVVGFALAGGGTSFGLEQGLGGGTSDLFQASVYARRNWGPAYLMGAFGYGWQDFTLKRTVTVAGSDKLEADFDGHTLAGRAEGGWRFGSPFAGVTPYAAVQVVSLDLPGFAERATSGANTFALSYASRTETQTRSELGARFDYAMPMRDGVLTLRGRAAWAHDFDTDRIANPVFLTLPGAAFTVTGATPDANLMLLSAGAELALANGFSIAGSFEGEFSGNTESYAGKGAIRYRW